MKHIITVQHDCTNEIKAYTSLKKVCEDQGVNYHSYKAKKFPFTINLVWTVRKNQVIR